MCADFIRRPAICEWQRFVLASQNKKQTEATLAKWQSTARIFQQITDWVVHYKQWDGRDGGKNPPNNR